MDNVFVILTATIMCLVGIRYSYLIIKKINQPVLTTWFLFSLITILSFATYLNSPEHSLTGNMVNFMDMLMTASIFLTLLYIGGRQAFRFSKLEKFCLVFTAITLVFWSITKDEFISNMFLQGIITIAYFPTIAKLYHAKHNT